MCQRIIICVSVSRSLRRYHIVTHIILWIRHRFVTELQKCYKCAAPYNSDLASVYNITCARDGVWRRRRTCPGILNSTICIYSFSRHGRGCWRVERPPILLRQIRPTPLSSSSTPSTSTPLSSTRRLSQSWPTTDQSPSPLLNARPSTGGQKSAASYTYK